MATIKRFEDLHVWQSARELMRMVIERQINSLISYLSHSRNKGVKEPPAKYIIEIPEDDESPLDLQDLSDL
jgi:hypothetical protein